MRRQMPLATIEDRIASFWEENPCGDQLVVGSPDDNPEFFADYDAIRYRSQGHILRCLDALNLPGKKTLEIGIGQGTTASSWSDGEQYGSDPRGGVAGPPSDAFARPAL